MSNSRLNSKLEERSLVALFKVEYNTSSLKVVNQSLYQSEKSHMLTYLVGFTAGWGWFNKFEQDLQTW